MTVTVRAESKIQFFTVKRRDSIGKVIYGDEGEVREQSMGVRRLDTSESRGQLPLHSL